MPVRVARWLAKHIVEHADGFTIFVKVKVKQLDAAILGLTGARQEIAGLDGGWESAPGSRPGDTNAPRSTTACA